MTNVVKKATTIVVGLVMLTGLAVSSAVRATADEETFIPVVNVPEGQNHQETFIPVVNVPEAPVEETFIPVINVPDVPDRDVPAHIEASRIQVIKFKDINGNGLEDTGEPRMSGVTFHLDANTADHRLAVTNTNGEIFWLQVSIASHIVREDVPAGFVVTTPNPVTVNVQEGQHIVVKFGNRPVTIPQEAEVPLAEVPLEKVPLEEVPLEVPKELPPTGPFEVLLPSTLGVLSTLYTMVRRQKRYTIELLRNL